MCYDTAPPGALTDAGAAAYVKDKQQTTGVGRGERVMAARKVVRGMSQTDLAAALPKLMGPRSSAFARGIITPLWLLADELHRDLQEPRRTETPPGRESAPGRE